jgi:hypothetical protein
MAADRPARLASPVVARYLPAARTARIDVSLWFVGAATVVVSLQVSGGTIVGTISDAATGAPIAGAEVTLTDLGRVVLADARGRYVVRDVAPGPQHVSVRHLGYAPRLLHALVPRIGEVAIDIRLERAPQRLRAVDVHPAVAIRGVDVTEPSSPMDRNVSAAAMRNHPLLAEPDAFLAASGGSIVMSPETPSGIHVRGGASDQTAFLLDGFPVLSPYHAAGSFSAWNPDALERLVVSPPSPALPDADALSGVVAATTRAPGDRLAAQGSISTTQARATIDGPLGLAGAAFLVSGRSGFPGFIAPKGEASYLRGKTHDALLAVELPVLGGRAHILGYESTNQLDASASARDSIPPFDARRNAFGWGARSYGARWSRRVGGVDLTVSGWRAESNADGLWNRADTAAHMGAARRDDGVTLLIDRAGKGERELEGETHSVAGLQLRRSRTSYRVIDDEGTDLYELGAHVPMTTLFGSHERALGYALIGKVAVSGTAVAGHVYGRSRGEVRWPVSPSLTLSTAYLHARQLAQTLRNAESITATIFPVDLYTSVGATGVPAARSDDGVLALDYRPFDGVKLAAQVYARTMGGLVLVAPRGGEPFSIGPFGTGAGSASGFSLDAGVSGARYGVVASYGWQRGRIEYRDAGFVPTYATTHLVETGVIVFPSPTSSIRLGLTGAAGRRATAVQGAFEWEACNLLDRGCEFGGSPRSSVALGDARIPSYLRLDLGVRKHWHLVVGSHDALVAAFGTITNVLGRPNVLTFSADPDTGEPTPIGMRPFAPLVVGVDWQF